MPDRDGQADGALEVGALRVAGDLGNGGIFPCVLEAFRAVLLEERRLTVAVGKRAAFSEVHGAPPAACGSTRPTATCRVPRPPSAAVSRLRSAHADSLPRCRS